MKLYGPYQRKDGRLHVVVMKDDGTRTTISYPKYLMQQYLGRELTKDETVDHIDNDKTNNDLSNLQILTRGANAQKAMMLKPRQIYTFVCPTCGNTAQKFFNYVKGNWKRGKAGPYCSRQCAGKVHN